MCNLCNRNVLYECVCMKVGGLAIWGGRRPVCVAERERAIEYE